MSRPVSVTRSLTPALTLIAFAAFVSTPAVLPRARMWIDFVIVTAPNPPGSRTLISPFAARLGDRARERLARRRTAAGVRIVADTGNPRARGLAERRGRKDQQERGR